MVSQAINARASISILCTYENKTKKKAGVKKHKWWKLKCKEEDVRIWILVWNHFIPAAKIHKADLKLQDTVAMHCS